VDWWQLACLLLIGAVVAAALMVLHTRLSLVTPRVEAAPPTTTPSPAAIGSLADALADLAVVRAEWRATQKQFDAYFEAFNDIDENVSRKQRRIAARQSKEEKEEGHEEAPADPRAALRIRARAAGIDGF